MAHEIEGNKAFFVSQPAWHGLGEVLTDAPSIEAAWRIAYPHTLVECPLQAYIDTENGRETMEITTHKAIIRDDGKHIGTVGAGYKLEQPHEVLSFFEPFLATGQIELEAGGSLRDGSRMWALGKIKNSETEVVKNDPIKAYLLAATAFDGTLARITKMCETRVVCANTMAIALGEDSDLEFKARHTKNMDQKIADAQHAIGAALNAHQTSVEAYRVLARKQVDLSTMKAYVRNVFVGDIDEPSPQLETKVNNVIDLIDNQRGLELVPAIRGTAWQAYNAISEHITHHASRTADARVSNQWFNGPTIALNRRALDFALAL